MIYYDSRFKALAIKTGTALLVFIALFNILLGLVYPTIDDLLYASLEEGRAYIFSELIYGIFYLLCFLLPAILYRIICRSDEREPMGFLGAPTKKAPLIIMAVIAVVFAFAQLNAMLVSSFDFYEYMQSVSSSDGRMSIVDFLLMTFTTALVPAICEEVLFRCTILSSLAPYGKSFAVIMSAILFGLMHQNPAQILYTTAAGIALGYAFIKTRSFLCVFLIHFLNNFLSVIQSLLLSNLPRLQSMRALILLDILVILLGAASIILLILSANKRKSAYETGSFGRILEAADGFCEKKVSFSVAKKFLLSPTVLIFVIICIAECAAWLFYSA